MFKLYLATFILIFIAVAQAKRPDIFQDMGELKNLENSYHHFIFPLIQRFFVHPFFFKLSALQYFVVYSVKDSYIILL